MTPPRHDRRHGHLLRRLRDAAHRGLRRLRRHPRVGRRRPTASCSTSPPSASCACSSGPAWSRPCAMPPPGERRRHGGDAAVRWRVRRPDPLPTLDELARSAAEHGIEHLGVAPATCWSGRGARSHERRDAGLAAGMAFTYRNPERSTDPQRAVPGARSIIVAARSYLADDEPAAARRPAGAGRPLRLGRPLRPAARRAAGDRPAAARPPASGPSRSPTTTRSSTARSPTAPGSAGSARTPTCCCRGAAAGSCSAASSPRPRYRAGRGAGRRRLRLVPALPRRAARPGRSSRPGVIDANRCLAWVLQQPGADPARAARGDRRPHLRLRRLPGGLPADRPARPPPPAPARRRRRRRGSTCSTCSTPTTRRCSTGTGAGTSPAATRAGCAATPSSCSATSATPATTARVGATLARYRDGDDAMLAEHARVGQRAARRSAATRAHGREAPARHERLPAEDRRDPVAAVGVVAAPAARPLRRAHQPVRRRRRSSTPPSRSASSGPASRCCCRTR